MLSNAGGASDRPLISVVVPIYNSEKYLGRCIDSIIAQTYENLEIILVDDASTDKSPEIIQEYSKKDSRIAAIKHEKNQSAFQARITGADAAKGKYLAFIDSDDYISVDWFRLLLKKAEDTNSDIVVGEFCFDYNGRARSYWNLDPFRICDYNLTGNDVLEAFMAQEGNCFSWWVVWNKLYKKDLWDSCAENFKTFAKEYGSIRNWNDVSISAQLWTKAKKATNVHGASYFYFTHNESLVATAKKDALQYIKSVSVAMLIMKKSFEDSGQYSRVEKHYKNWRRRAASMLYRVLVTSETKQYEKIIREVFNETEDFLDYKDSFYSITTNLAPSFEWYENIKRQICNPQVKVISFDIFDTLIQRPFLNPADMFHFLSYKYNEERSSFVDFYKIRVEAEAQARKKIALTRPSIEEITLGEIYNEIAEQTVIPKETLERLKKMEISLETHFSEPRKSGKELYDLALEQGKKIILCSDMYLPGEVVKEILKQNGFEGYEKFYISSEIKKTKAQKSLFNHVAKDLKIKNKKNIFHIGDNWNSDVLNPKSCGWNFAHLPNSINMFCGKEPGIYSGKSYSKIFQNNDRMENYGAMINTFPSVSGLFGLVAHKFFDNPFQSFNLASDFNSSPEYIGYYALGFHLLSLVRWLEKIAKERKIPTIHFVARDGYLLKKAFDMYNRSETKSNYIRLSRKSTLLFDVESIEDLYSMSKKIHNIFASTPLKLLKMFEPIIPDERKIKTPKFLEKNRFIEDAFFHSTSEFDDCLKLILEELVDISLLSKYKEALRAYFSEIIKPGDYIFDIGYGGRPEATLSMLLGFPVNSFYIHTNEELAEIRQNKYGFERECFYSYNPKISYLIRENLFSELAPSTIGYKLENGELKPIFDDDYESDYYSKFITTTIQNSALKFIEDFLKIFEKFRDEMILPRSLLSAPFEFYLHYSLRFDRLMFSSMMFEDTLGNQEGIVDIFSRWNDWISRNGLTPENNMYISRMPAIPSELQELYMDGLFVKLYKKINKIFPKGGRAREVVKKIAKIFIR